MGCAPFSRRQLPFLLVPTRSAFVLHTVGTSKQARYELIGGEIKLIIVCLTSDISREQGGAGFKIYAYISGAQQTHGDLTCLHTYKD